MSVSSLPTRRRAVFICVYAAATALMCAAIAAAAVLVPAPPAALPMIVVVCVGLPMVVAYELPGAVATLRAQGTLRRRHLTHLCRELERLPETQHPLGL